MKKAGVLHVETVQRTLPGPSLEWLSRDQLAAWLNIGGDVLDDLVKRAKIAPRGVVLGRRTVRWHWRDAVAISIALTWQGNARDGPE